LLLESVLVLFFSLVHCVMCMPVMFLILIFSLESFPGLFKRLQIQAQATLASGIGSLESIPGLSLSPYLETFKEPRNQFQGTREPRNQEPRTDCPYQ
jgi:hypothetical protein